MPTLLNVLQIFRQKNAKKSHLNNHPHHAGDRDERVWRGSAKKWTAMSGQFNCPVMKERKIHNFLRHPFTSRTE
jgi:hypothetical protein